MVKDFNCLGDDDSFFDIIRSHRYGKFPANPTANHRFLPETSYGQEQQTAVFQCYQSKFNIKTKFDFSFKNFSTETSQFIFTNANCLLTDKRLNKTVCIIQNVYRREGFTIRFKKNLEFIFYCQQFQFLSNTGKFLHTSMQMPPNCFIFPLIYRTTHTSVLPMFQKALTQLQYFFYYLKFI